MYVHVHAFLASGWAFPGSAAEPEVSAEDSDVFFFLNAKVRTTACESLDKLLVSASLPANGTLNATHFKEAILECIF